MRRYRAVSSDPPLTPNQVDARPPWQPESYDRFCRQMDAGLERLLARWARKPAPAPQEASRSHRLDGLFPGTRRRA
jgi:hypothetical protein